MQYTQSQLPENRKLLYAWFSAMFTRIDVLIWVDSTRDDLVDIAGEIETQVNRIELMANRFNEASELSFINANAYSGGVAVSAELFEIVQECILYNSKTLGCFDITVNSLNDFRLGMAHISLNTELKTIQFTHKDVKLDLSGFIKGYALRSIRELLREKGIDNALVNMGNSSVLAMGNHPYGKGWNISHPDYRETNECLLFDECLTTSGNTEYTKWPTLNPVTGTVIPSERPVSVITTDPALGEVLSTALYVAGSEEREMIVKQFDVREIHW